MSSGLVHIHLCICESFTYRNQICLLYQDKKWKVGTGRKEQVYDNEEKAKDMDSIGHHEGGINTFCCFSFNANWFLSLSTKCFMVLLGARWEASFANSSSSLSTSIYA